MTGIRATYY